MSNYCRVILVGHTLRTPELGRTPKGTASCDLFMAVTDRRKDRLGNWVEETNRFGVKCWGRNAEIACEYLKPGSMVLIQGRLEFYQWENPPGRKRSMCKVRCERLQLLDRAPTVGGPDDQPVVPTDSRGGIANAPKEVLEGAPEPRDDEAHKETPGEPGSPEGSV